MTPQLDKLLDEIEKCRNKMVELASTTSYTNKRVVYLSTKLDGLLNHYYHITEKK
jgi:hypothetical protein